MKRAALLHCSDCDVEYFKLLDRRDQLPASVFGSDYSLKGAFELRLMLDLIGGEGSETDDGLVLNGLAPSVAYRMVGNVVRRFDPHPLNAPPTAPDQWFAVVVFEDPEGNPQRSTYWFADRIEELPRWMAVQSVKHMEAWGRPLTPVRIFMANATRAANFVRDRAAELGLPEANDFPEVK